MKIPADSPATITVPAIMDRRGQHMAMCDRPVFFGFDLRLVSAALPRAAERSGMHSQFSSIASDNLPITVIAPEAPLIRDFVVADTVARFDAGRFSRNAARDFFFTRNSSSRRLSNIVPYSGPVDRPKYIK